MTVRVVIRARDGELTVLKWNSSSANLKSKDRFEVATAVITSTSAQRSVQEDQIDGILLYACTLYQISGGERRDQFLSIQFTFSVNVGRNVWLLILCSSSKLASFNDLHV